MNNNNYVVILAGGTGSRFWPLSRKENPKQFLDVLGVGKSLIQLTYDRLSKICKTENFLIITTAEYKRKIKEHLPLVNDEQIVAEPERKNTAACIALACMKIKNKNPKASVIIAPSDHLVLREDEYQEVLKLALKESVDGEKLITIGIRPNKPETGYGYIQYISNKDSKIKKVKTFTEKPQIELAQSFVKSGDFLWNSGMFIWQVDTLIKGIEEHLPDLYEALADAEEAFDTENEDAALVKAYSMIRAISIDYGLMEKAENVYVIPGEFGWSDLGSWSSLYDTKPKDDQGNLIEANSLIYNSMRNYIKGSKDKLILVHGLEDYLVADCDNVLVICPRELESEFREFVNDAKNQKGNEFI